MPAFDLMRFRLEVDNLFVCPVVRLWQAPSDPGFFGGTWSRSTWVKNKFKKFPGIIFVERYMIHLKNGKYAPRDSRKLVYRARDLCSDMHASVRVARVASNFIEFDVGVDAEDLDMLIEKLSPIGSLMNARHIFEENTSKEDGIKDGIFYFNNERFWECHEAFEGVWNKCFGREKDLVQGIILVAVAFAHGQKDDQGIGIGMLSRALEKLGDSPALYNGIDVDQIRSKSKEMQKTKTLSRFEI